MKLKMVEESTRGVKMEEAGRQVRERGEATVGDISGCRG